MTVKRNIKLKVMLLIAPLLGLLQCVAILTVAEIMDVPTKLMIIDKLSAFLGRYMDQAIARTVVIEQIGAGLSIVVFLQFVCMALLYLCSIPLAIGICSILKVKVVYRVTRCAKKQHTEDTKQIFVFFECSLKKIYCIANN